MISRRRLLGTTVAITTASVVPSVFATTKPIQPTIGKEMLEVFPPVDFPPRPILVHDFFAYTCPHCLSFEPIMHEWIESVKNAPDIKVIPVPVAWNETYEIFPRTYYTFESMGRMSDLHPQFWEWVVREPHEWNTIQDVEKDIFAWVKKKGADVDQFGRLIKSFAVMSKTRQATRTWKNYGIDSTPSIGIAGRFITAPHLAGTRRGTIDVLNAIIERLRLER